MDFKNLQVNKNNQIEHNQNKADTDVSNSYQEQPQEQPQRQPQRQQP